jgi:hypothetical protein
MARASVHVSLAGLFLDERDDLRLAKARRVHCQVDVLRRTVIQREAEPDQVGCERSAIIFTQVDACLAYELGAVRAKRCCCGSMEAPRLPLLW